MTGTNYYEDHECAGMKTKLARIINNGGPLTELDLRRLEDCDTSKPSVKTIKKGEVKKIIDETKED